MEKTIRNIKRRVFCLSRYLPWLFLLLGVDAMAALLLWISEAEAFEVLLPMILLGTVLLFTGTAVVLGNRELRREEAFQAFLDDPDLIKEEDLLRIVSKPERESVRLLGTVLREKDLACRRAKADAEDYEEYVEAWAHETKTPLSLLTMVLDNQREEIPAPVYKNKALPVSENKEESRSTILHDSSSFRLEKKNKATAPGFQVKEEFFPEDFGVFGGKSIQNETAVLEETEKKENVPSLSEPEKKRPYENGENGELASEKGQERSLVENEKEKAENFESPNGQQGFLPEERSLRLIGEAFGTYIILEVGKEELLFIDKHAAHERMLYERLKEDKQGTGMQMLLEPIPVTLDKNEYAAVLEGLSLFEEAGFEIEDFGSGTVLVRSAPMLLESGDVASSVMEMAGYLLEKKNDLHTEKLDWLYHNIACRAAVKAGDESSPMELAQLALRLLHSPDIRYCPHGRPVSILMKRRDLEKQFGRV